jgi:hypothetical protein
VPRIKLFTILEKPWHKLCFYRLADGTTSIRRSKKPVQSINHPIQKQTTMNKDITPEIISDEQLEEVAGGLADVENNSCVALYQATAQINL